MCTRFPAASMDPCGLYATHWNSPWLCMVFLLLFLSNTFNVVVESAMAIWCCEIAISCTGLVWH